MSRQYPNRPLIPPRRRASHQMRDLITYPTSQVNDTSADGLSRQTINSISSTHQLPASSESSATSMQNDPSYFHRTLEPPSFLPNRELNNNSSRILYRPNELYHYNNPQSNERELTRPSLPLSVATSAAATAASFPHHNQFRLENVSAAAFTRHPPWFDDDSEDTSEIVQHSSRSNHHTKRQRSSATSASTSQSSQSFHHHERKRSRHEGLHDDNTRTNFYSQENVSTSRSSNHHQQPYSNYRYPQPNLLPRTLYNDNVSSTPRSFDQRSQNIQRNRMDNSHEIMNTNIHSTPSHHNTLSSALPTQSRNVYFSANHRPLVLETPPVALPHRQANVTPRPYTQQQQNHHQRSGITVESVPQRPPLFHRTSMTPRLHQRPASSFLTDLLHRVIDAHAASYGDNHVHYHHHHHPPTASIDLIAYAWLSPSHDIFSLPAAFSIQFSDFFDLTIPDETPVVGLTDSELERLPTIIFTKSCTNIQDDDKCAVCLSEYVGGEKLKRLRCKHYFHSECIDPWLKTSTRCPICRGEQTS